LSFQFHTFQGLHCNRGSPVFKIDQGETARVTGLIVRDPQGHNIPER
jgi:hypothetical protein